MNRFLFGGLMLASGFAVPASDSPATADVAALVRRLGSADPQERDEAGRQLAALRADEPPAELLAALKSSDADVRRRAEAAAAAIRTAALARLPRDQRLAARGQVDLYVACTAALAFKDDDDRHWVPPTKLGAKLVSLLTAEDDDDERKPQGGPTWFADFATYRKAWPGDFIRKDGRYDRPAKDADGLPLLHQAIQAGGVEAGQSLSGLVVARGPVRAPQCISNALILATGEVKAGDNVTDSVIVCDGNVRTGKLFRCVVIARGNITVEGQAETATLIAGGKVTITRPQVPDGEPRAVFQRRVVVSENDANPLKFVTFFELSRVGLSVRAGGDGLTVATVAAGSACDKGGLKGGDAIVDVGGKKPTDGDSLRRLLRDALAVGDATVRVKRGDDTTTVKVALPE
jgi:hypothetical protein